MSASRASTPRGGGTTAIGDLPLRGGLPPDILASVVAAVAECDLSVGDLADAVGLSSRSVRRILKGRQRPSPAVARLLTEVLDLGEVTTTRLRAACQPMRR